MQVSTCPKERAGLASLRYRRPRRPSQLSLFPGLLLCAPDQPRSA